MDADTAAKLAALGMTPGGSANISTSSGSDSEDAIPVDMDVLLSQSLSDVPDLADYVSPKNGAYNFHVDAVDTEKILGESKVIQIDYTITGVIEADANSMGDNAKVGDKYSELYFMGTQKSAVFNLGRLKKLLVPVAEKFGTTSFRETLDKYAGCDIAGIIKNKKDRNDKDVVRSSLIKIVFTQ